MTVSRPPAGSHPDGPPRVLTLLDLVTAIDEVTGDDRETVAVLRHLLATRRVARVASPVPTTRVER